MSIVSLCLFYSNISNKALKHYTSKLSSYADLTDLQTFGFRGEALSSLCALSRFHILTAQADEAPKGKRLDFEISGKLNSTSIVASQKGTTAVVESLFESLPVRRKELTKNIKREYGKVIGLLHAYACVSTGIKFTVKSSMHKGKSATVFATRGNPTTKDNIANVYGTKTLSALLPLEQELAFSSNSATNRLANHDGDVTTQKIIVRGHISRPVFGEGRQTPDRQMFFVNARPCGLPQIAKAINEVYKSFNVSQSPFIFADFRMDTRAYDVNVSPDKRTILLHDSSEMVEALKASLLELFESQDQTVPQSQLHTTKLPSFKRLTVQRSQSGDKLRDLTGAKSDDDGKTENTDQGRGRQASSDDGREDTHSLLHDFFRDTVSTRPDPEDATQSKAPRISKAKEKMAKSLGLHVEETMKIDEYEDAASIEKGIVEECELSPEPSAESANEGRSSIISAIDGQVRDLNAKVASQEARKTSEQHEEESMQDQRPPKTVDEAVAMPRQQPNVVQNAFDRMRPKRSTPDVATITVGDKTITTMIGSQTPKKSDLVSSARGKNSKSGVPNLKSSQKFGQSLRNFAAPGTQAEDEDKTESLEEEELSDAPDEPVSQDSQMSIADQEMTIDSEEDDESGTDNSSEPSPVKGAEDVVGDEQSVGDQEESDQDYLDEEEEKLKEKQRVADLIRRAEEEMATPTDSTVKRANKALKGGSHKDSTAHLLTTLDGSIERLEDYARHSRAQKLSHQQNKESRKRPLTLDEESAEDRLSLTVSKADFSAMHIIGQFNLGFILAVRPGEKSDGRNPSKRQNDELFIIDQHASDEIYNFERLQLETIVGNQRLVRPKALELTAVEEEIILENKEALEKNGFLVDVDLTGDEAIGQRCKLVSLPLSKEVIFDIRDLEELIHLLSEAPGFGTSSVVPRPSKVRKMFAMRACRSSIMIGKTLTNKQMATVIRHMGEMDKPWNCPHGRPTMRHLMSLDAFETWKEGDGLADDDEHNDDKDDKDESIWEQFT